MRVAGYGQVIAAYDGQQPHFDACTRFNFTAEQLSVLQPTPASLLGPAAAVAAEEGFVEREALTVATEAEDRRTYNLSGRGVEERQLIDKRLREGCDSLVIATRFHPLPIFQTTLPLLLPSQPFVVFSEYIEVCLFCLFVCFVCGWR